MNSKISAMSVPEKSGRQTTTSGPRVSCALTYSEFEMLDKASKADGEKSVGIWMRNVALRHAIKKTNPDFLIAKLAAFESQLAEQAAAAKADRELFRQALSTLAQETRSQAAALAKIVELITNQ